jgi:hypothetical protein
MKEKISEHNDEAVLAFDVSDEVLEAAASRAVLAAAAMSLSECAYRQYLNHVLQQWLAARAVLAGRPPCCIVPVVRQRSSDPRAYLAAGERFNPSRTK